MQFRPTDVIAIVRCIIIAIVSCLIIAIVSCLIIAIVSSLVIANVFYLICFSTKFQMPSTSSLSLNSHKLIWAHEPGWSYHRNRIQEARVLGYSSLEIIRFKCY